MSLNIWTAGSDPYDHDQLADNFFKLDQHNHGQGMGAQIGADGIADASLLAQHFTNASIATAFLVDASITSRKLAPTKGRVSATADLAMTVTAQDVPGASVTVTPEIDGTLLVQGAFYLSTVIGTGQTGDLEGLLTVDGTIRTPVAKLFQSVASGVSGPSIAATVGQIWLVPLTAGVAHTVKLQGRFGLSNTATNGNVIATNTGFSYILYGA